MKQWLLIMKLSTLLFLPMIFSSCNGDEWPCISGTGLVVTNNRSVGNFSKVNLENEAQLHVQQGDSLMVRIEAQQNVIDNLETTNSGDELTIRNHHCVVSAAPINIYIVMPTLTRLEVGGSGSAVTTGTFNSSSCDFVVSGSGDIITNDSITAASASTNISGSGSITVFGRFGSFDNSISGSGILNLGGVADNESIDISGSGKVYAYTLTSNYVSTQTNGSGTLQIHADKTLDTKISGSGDVYYKGYPVINVSVSGSGKLINAN